MTFDLLAYPYYDDMQKQLLKLHSTPSALLFVQSQDTCTR